MQNIKIETHSVKETIELGKKIAASLDKGCIISLEGDLGTGKTHLVKGIAQGLGIEQTINSPTFTLIKEYEGRLNLKHIDAYRLEGIDALSLALEDLIDDENLICIEWSGFIEGLNPDISIKIKYIDENTRQIEVNYHD